MVATMAPRGRRGCRPAGGSSPGGADSQVAGVAHNGAVPPSAPTTGPSRGRVLVVDDDAALAEMLGIVLRREGYEPAFVSDGARALATFQQLRPDLVLLDLMLPGRNG